MAPRAGSRPRRCSQDGDVMQGQVKHVYVVRADAAGIDGAAIIKVGTTSNLFATLSRLSEALDGVSLIGVVEAEEALAARVCEVLEDVALDCATAMPLPFADAACCFAIPRSIAEALRLALLGSLADVMARRVGPGPTQPYRGEGTSSGLSWAE